MWERLNSKPTFFRKIDRDIKSKDPIEGIKDMRNVLTDQSVIMNMYYLSKGKILIQYYAPHKSNTKYGLSIVDIEGNKILKEDILLDSRIILAKDNKVFIAVQPKGDNKTLPNPVIEIYEYKH